MADHVTPNLPSRDFDVTEAFYAKLGFATSWKDRGWMILQRGGLQLEFFPYPDLDPATSSFGCCLRLDDLDAMVALVNAAGAEEKSTGLARLRAATPPHWQAGDKTGSAIAPLMPNKTHDVAVFWPPGRAPVIVAAYYESDAHHAGRIRAQDEAVLAQVGRIAVAWAGD